MHARTLMTTAALAIACATALPAKAEENPRMIVATFILYSTKCGGVSESHTASMRFFAMSNGIDVSDPEQKAAIAMTAGTLLKQFERMPGGIGTFCRQGAAALGLR